MRRLRSVYLYVCVCVCVSNRIIIQTFVDWTDIGFSRVGSNQLENLLSKYWTINRNYFAIKCSISLPCKAEMKLSN